jgi:hypothetical protein
MQVIVRRSDLGEQQPLAIGYFADNVIIRDLASYGSGLTVLTLPDTASIITSPGEAARLVPNWRSYSATIVNAEANRRIQLSFTDYSQRNANQDVITSITKYGAETTMWPQDAQDRKATADTGWNFVNTIRETSDAMIAGMPLDPTDDGHWPTQIPPVWIPPV